MAELPCTGLSWPLPKPPCESCAIYFHYAVTICQDFPNMFFNRASLLFFAMQLADYLQTTQQRLLATWSMYLL